jgi:PBP1b-binding outer membrane lipoprotein LpoB
MKKVILSFVAIAALTVVSCKGKDAENTDAAADTTATVESTTVETPAPAAADTTAAAPAADTTATKATTTTSTEVKK